MDSLKEQTPMDFTSTALNQDGGKEADLYQKKGQNIFKDWTKH